MASVTHRGSFVKTQKWLKTFLNKDWTPLLSKYGQMGVDALSSTTPIDSGDTAGSWGYKVRRSGGFWEIIFTNRNVNKGLPIAILIQYGHGTRTGGYVQGIDYINPAIRPVFDKMVDDIWKEMTRG